MSESTSPEVSPARLEMIAKAVRLALEEAEKLESGETSIYLSDASDPEAIQKRVANLRAKAEKLMHDYRITEEGLIATDQFSITPITRKIKISNWSSKFRTEHWYMWYYTAEHTGCRTNYEYVAGDMVAVVVGYESDIRHAEALYMSAWLMMVAKLEPTKDEKASDAENIYRLRSSGKTRRQIAKIMWGLDTHAAHAKVGKIYEDECTRRGEQPIVSGRGVSKEVFQDTYAEAFVARYYRRLCEARDAADSAAGGLPVLPGRKERVDEAFYQVFPSMRPDTAEERAARLARQEKEKPKKEKPYKVTKADINRYHRHNKSAAALAGKAAGRNAADQVELNRTTPNAQRVEAGGPGTPSQLSELGN